MSGGIGDDAYVVDSAADVVNENAGEGTDLVNASLSYVLATNVENLTLTGTAANGTGNAVDNVIRGNDAANTLDGGAGADKLYGGLGDDVFIVDNAGDKVIENAGEGTDLVNASISWVLGSQLENLTLTGGATINGTGNSLGNVIRGNGAANVLDGGFGNDSLLGGGGADTLIGGNGSDTLSGGAGGDTMTGGLGDDLYYVDSVGDGVTENASEGIDTVISTITYTLGANVENLTLSGSANLNGTGNALGNTLRGNGGNNLLDGGAGIDKMFGGAGDDTYIVDNHSDRVNENAGAGTDLVMSSVNYTLSANVEDLTLTGDGHIKGTGNTLDNHLTGNDTVNTLGGLAGNDTLIGNGGNDWLDGGSGADTMIGGTGNDTYVVDNALDTVTENASEGTDLVRSTISYTLGDNVEYLSLRGTADIDGTGNALNNQIRGNDGSNVLDGGAGNDKIYGLAGADTLTGGSGADHFLFDDGETGGLTTATCDRITDFSHAENDKIDLSAIDANSLVAGDQGFAFIGTGAFSGTAGELRYEESGGNTFVYGDTNGDGIADFMIKVDGSHAFTGADIGL